MNLGSNSDIVIKNDTHDSYSLISTIVLNTANLNNKYRVYTFTFDILNHDKESNTNISILNLAIKSIQSLDELHILLYAFKSGLIYTNEFGSLRLLPDHKIEVGNMYSNFSEREDEIAEFDEKIVLRALHIYFHSMDWYAMMRLVYAPELYSSVTSEERKKALKLFDEFCLSRGVEIEDPFIPDPEFFEAFPEMRSNRG